MSRYPVTVVGATGVVGQEMRIILEQRDFPVDSLRLLASERSLGREFTFKGQSILVEVLDEARFRKGEIVLSSPGASVSKQFAPRAIEQGAVVIDNTSAFRMEEHVPLVVPEVNPHALHKDKRLISNPNCSTIQMVVALAPLHRQFRVVRIVASTYQSVSGKGSKAIEELTEQTKNLLAGRVLPPREFPHQMAFNCLPHIDVFLENGFTKEEMKMVHETHKILEDNEIGITATTVRVPVIISHSESIYIETERKVTADQAREILSQAPGVKVVDDPANNLYPLATEAAGRDETFVGRIREDLFHPRGLNMWVVSDNLRKGAALNTIQIAEEMIARKLL